MRVQDAFLAPRFKCHIFCDGQLPQQLVGDGQVQHVAQNANDEVACALALTFLIHHSQPLADAGVSDLVQPQLSELPRPEPNVPAFQNYRAFRFMALLFEIELSVLLEEWGFARRIQLAPHYAPPAACGGPRGPR